MRPSLNEPDPPALPHLDMVLAASVEQARHLGMSAFTLGFDPALTGFPEEMSYEYFCGSNRVIRPAGSFDTFPPTSLE
jgi:hypothetical protein